MFHLIDKRQRIGSNKFFQLLTRQWQKYFLVNKYVTVLVSDATSSDAMYELASKDQHRP